MSPLAPPPSHHPPEDEDDGIYLAAVEGGGTTFVVSVAKVICRRDDDDDDKEEEENILRIGPTKLRILETRSFPPRDEITGIIPPWTPDMIVGETCAFLAKCRAEIVPGGGRYSAVGIATFGPAGVDPSSRGGRGRSGSSYGTILPGTPKKEWRGFDLLAPVAVACGIPGGGGGGGTGWVGFDTDVNAPALAEFRHRNHLSSRRRRRRAGGASSGSPSEEEEEEEEDKPLTSLSYVTVGTGVGVGLIVNSSPVHGLLHPEGGHVAIRTLDGDDFDGYSWGKDSSPYGGRGTVEGVASSVALTERYLRTMMTTTTTTTTTREEEKKGTTTTTTSGEEVDDDDVLVVDAQSREVLSSLPDDHPIWDHASNAIANLCVSILLLTSCQKIVLGGGVMNRTSLYGSIRKRVWNILNGYLDSVVELSEEGRLDDVIVGGSWEGTMGSGLVGAYALALDAYDDGIEAARAVSAVGGRGGGGGGGGRGPSDANDDDDDDGGGGEANKEEEGSLSVVVAAASPDEGGGKVVADRDDDDDDYDDDDEQHRRSSSSFAFGVLAGIGLSFGCMLVASVLGRGERVQKTWP